MRNQRKLKDLRRSVAEGNARRSTDGRDSLEDIVRHASMTTFEDKEELSDKDAKPVPKQSKEAKELPQRDMYRAFDGSALMAIGMLVLVEANFCSWSISRHASARVCCASS